MEARFEVQEVPAQIQKLFDMTGIAKFFVTHRRIPNRKESKKE